MLKQYENLLLHLDKLHRHNRQGSLKPRERFHLRNTARGHKLFVPDNRLTHEAIKDFQRFLADNRPLAQDPDSDRPMTFHGLWHTRAAERSGIRNASKRGGAPIRPGKRLLSC